MPGAVLQIQDTDAAGLVGQGIVADGDAAAGGVAVGLLAVDVVGGPLIAAQQVDLGAAFGIRLDRLPQSVVASVGHLPLPSRRRSEKASNA